MSEKAKGNPRFIEGTYPLNLQKKASVITSPTVGRVQVDRENNIRKRK